MDSSHIAVICYKCTQYTDKKYNLRFKTMKNWKITNFYTNFKNLFSKFVNFTFTIYARTGSNDPCFCSALIHNQLIKQHHRYSVCLLPSSCRYSLHKSTHEAELTWVAGYRLTRFIRLQMVTHPNLPMRDGQAELTWMAGYRLTWFARLRMVTCPSDNRAPMPRLSQTAMLPPTDALCMPYVNNFTSYHH